MIVFPNSKINLGLHITRKREDGFHDLQSIFYPLPFTDSLEILPAKQDLTERSPAFHCYGISLPGEPLENICIKAWRLLKKEFPSLPSIEMHLLKAIPAGAGLGGGSADGAFTLKLLNDIFQLGLTTAKLLDYATLLGSDCPFFIINQSSYVSGRGEIIEPFPVNLSKYSIVLINPGIPIDTSWAFTQVVPMEPRQSLKNIILQPVETWQAHLTNDFEEPVFAAYPSIRAIKENLYRLGAIYASMSGSGSTVYGIFDKETRPELDFPAHYFVKSL